MSDKLLYVQLVNKWSPLVVGYGEMDLFKYLEALLSFERLGMSHTEDTFKLDEMLKQSILASKIEPDLWLVLREWNNATPYVVHSWTSEMGYFWGHYFSGSDLEEAKAFYREILKEKS